MFDRSVYGPLKAEEGMRIIRKNYSDGFLDECKLDIRDEVSLYNKQRAYDSIDFMSWFAIRDYKEDGYVHINRFLQGLQNPDTKLGFEDLSNRCKKLTQAINSLSILQDSNDFFSEGILFRAETCYKKDMQHINLEQGEIFERPTFISTSEEKETTFEFCCCKKDLKESQINIYYTISRTSLLVGANISALVNDQEAEVLFPPKTKFIIQDVTRNEKSIHIKLITEDIDRSVWLENFGSVQNFV